MIARFSASGWFRLSGLVFPCLLHCDAGPILGKVTPQPERPPVECCYCVATPYSRGPGREAQHRFFSICN
uniref:Putative secreted peptide n=1 Tax=Anopheles braziliensis TaxID=58242 RepID=A0A2M3ZW35_9DIPT